MAQPLLSRLKDAGAKIEVLAPEWVAAVLRRMPEVDHVIAMPYRHGALQLGERWRLARAIAARGYDRAIVLPNSWKSALIPFLAGIPRRAGYVGELRYGLLNSTLPNSKSPMPQHYARLAGPLEGALAPPRLTVSTDEIAEAQQRFGIAGAYAVLCPGAEYGPAANILAQLSRTSSCPLRRAPAGCTHTMSSSSAHTAIMPSRSQRSSAS